MIIEEIFETIAMTGGLNKEFKYKLKNYYDFTGNKKQAKQLYNIDYFKYNLAHYLRQKIEDNHIIILPLEDYNDNKHKTDSNKLLELLEELGENELILDLTSLDLSVDNETSFIGAYISNEEDRIIIIPTTHYNQEECYNQFLGPIQIMKEGHNDTEFWGSSYTGITINNGFVFDNSEFNNYSVHENNSALLALNIIYNALLDFQEQIKEEEIEAHLIKITDTLLKNEEKLNWLLKEITLYAKDKTVIELVGNYQDKIKLKVKDDEIIWKKKDNKILEFLVSNYGGMLYIKTPKDKNPEDKNLQSNDQDLEVNIKDFKKLKNKSKNKVKNKVKDKPKDKSKNKNKAKSNKDDIFETYELRGFSFEGNHYQQLKPEILKEIYYYFDEDIEFI